MKRVHGIALLLAAVAIPACNGDHAASEKTAAASAPADTTYNPICSMAGVDTLCSALPHMVEVKLQNGYSGLNPRDQRHFDVFSWQSFVALNWPADDKGNPLPSFSGNPGAPRVWETFESASDLYGSGKSPCALAAGQKLLGQMAKNGDVVDPGGDFDEAVGGPLMDRNLNFVLYEKRVNGDEAAYIRANRLNTAAGQYAADSAGRALTFPQGTYADTAARTGGMAGAVEIKAAWRVLQPAAGDDTTRYYRRHGVVYVAARNSSTGQPLCLNATVGLVGMHIAHKTPSFDEAWIWTTFEHVDNAPTCATTGTCNAGQTRWSFYNAQCPNCVRNDSLHLKGTTDSTFLWAPTPPYAIRYAIGGKYGNQITRTQPIYAETDSVNAEWMPRVRGTVWENYRLIGSQWMSGDGPEDRIPAPAVLRNTTMESYLPDSSSCLGCHQFARTLGLPGSDSSVFADFSFLLHMARNPDEAPGLPRFSEQAARPVPITRHPTLVMRPIPGRDAAPKP